MLSPEKRIFYHRGTEAQRFLDLGAKNGEICLNCLRSLWQSF